LPKEGTLTTRAGVRKKRASEDDFRNRLQILDLDIGRISPAYALKL